MKNGGACTFSVRVLLLLLIGAVLSSCALMETESGEGRLATSVAATLTAGGVPTMPPPPPSPQADEIQPTSSEVIETPTALPPAFPLYKEGQGAFLPFGSCYDLDGGASGAAGSQGCDFTVIASPGGGGNVIDFQPTSPAGFGFGGVLPVEPSIEQCRASGVLKSSAEAIVPLASMFICYQTGEGRYGYLSFSATSESGVTFNWRSFDPPGAMTTLALTPTPTPTTAPVVTDADLPQGDPDYRDRFTIPSNWELYENAHVKFDLVNEKFILKAFQPDGWDGWILTWPKLDDFYLEATFTTGDDCAGLDRYGLVARQTNPDDLYVGYLVGLSCDGRYSLRSWEGDGFTTQIPWTSSTFIRPGPNQTHTLGFLADGDRIVLYVDRHRLREITDNAHASGKFGFFVAAKQSVGFTVEIKEIAYWKLP